MATEVVGAERVGGTWYKQFPVNPLSGNYCIPYDFSKSLSDKHIEILCINNSPSGGVTGVKAKKIKDVKA